MGLGSLRRWTMASRVMLEVEKRVGWHPDVGGDCCGVAEALIEILSRV